jgi:hypothetical protein
MGKESKLNILSLPGATDAEPQMTVSKKLQVSYYEGEGVEGLPYYDILSR